MGAHRGGTEHPHRTATTTIRITKIIRFLKHNCAKYAEPDIWDERTGTGQYSPYKIKLCSNVTIITNDCNDEWNVVTTQDLICRFNKFRNTKEKILLLDMKEQLLSWDQNTPLKKNQDTNMIHTTGKYLGSEKGVRTTVGENKE